MSPLGQADRVGPYEIVGAIGQGAMGVVYLAKDSRLSRRVAIKVISKEAELDISRRRRFVQEARAASALNHPNIVTVHDFGTENGLSYIVTELVEGESLRKSISRGAVRLRKLAEVAIQIADALAAAHEAGIVHRDLKPENIMITPAGRVKLLDFGLAKPLGSSSSEHTIDEDATQPGVLLGTVAYMSPEQTRGAPASIQSDQFSFGLILHELATGHHPFRRETPMETLIAIANFERPPFTPGPVAFRLLVQRCLSKDPTARFSATAEIADRLRKIHAQLPEEPVVQSPKPRAWRQVSPRTVSALLIGIGLFSLGLFCLGLLVASRLTTISIRDPSTFQFVPFAADSGLELFPAWSPNGGVIAFSAERTGVLQIFTRAPGSLLSTPVTRSAADCMFPFWAPDGSRLYYIAEHDTSPALWSINIAGGAPELVSDGVAQAAVSPDGQMLAMLRPPVDGAPSWSLWIASPPSAAPKRLSGPPFAHEAFEPWSYLHYSPDSSTLAFWGARLDGRSEFWLIPRDGPTPRLQFESLNANPLARGFTWLPDSRRIIFAEQAPLGSTDHLWSGDTRNGELTEITNGPSREQFPSSSPSGVDAAFSSMIVHYELRSLTVGGASPQAPPPSTTLNALAPAWSPDGQQYAYVTERSGSPEIRIRSANGEWERVMVTAGDFDGPTHGFMDVAFSPNGQSIAYTRQGSKGNEIWISTVSGESPQRVTQNAAGFDRGPAWSPDGNSIAYFTVHDGRYALMRTRLGSADRVKIIRRDAGLFPAWSPRGDTIATVDPHSGILLVAADGSSVRHAGSGRWLAATWTKRGEFVLGIAHTLDGRLALAEISPDNGSQSILQDLGPWPAAFSFGSGVGLPPIRGISIAPDERTISFSALDVKSDIWLLKGLTEPGLLSRWRSR
jgi:serine/threonine protein kinase